MRQGYGYICLAIGGYFGRVTKPTSDLKSQQFESLRLQLRRLHSFSTDHRPRNVEYFVTTRMAATRVGFSHPAGFDLGLRNRGHLWLLRESISCFVSCGFRLHRGGSTSRAQNLKFRAQNFDLHRSEPQHSGTPKNGSF